jgi:hypothetical protein
VIILILLLVDESFSISYDVLALLFGGSIVSIPSRRTLHSVVRFPNLLPHVLVVYRVTPVGNGVDRCDGMYSAF